MKLEVIETVKVTKEVDIDLPYYYRHDLDNSTIYGKIEEKKCTYIQLTNYDYESIYELNIEHRPANYFGCYMTEEYAGTEEEFLRAVRNMLDALDTV